MRAKRKKDKPMSKEVIEIAEAAALASWDADDYDYRSYAPLKILLFIAMAISPYIILFMSFLGFLTLYSDLEFILYLIFLSPFYFFGFLIIRYLEMKNWNQVSIAKMHNILLETFQDPELQERLLITNNKPLIATSKIDAFWGIGKKGKGKNMLGKLLMDVRSSLCSSEVKLPNQEMKK